MDWTKMPNIMMKRTMSTNKIILKIVCKEIDRSLDALEGSFTQLTCDLYTNANIKKEYAIRINRIKKDIKTLKTSLVASAWRAEKINQAIIQKSITKKSTTKRTNNMRFLNNKGAEHG